MTIGINFHGHATAKVWEVAGSSWVSIQAADYKATVTLFFPPYMASAVATAINAPKPRVTTPHAELVAIAAKLAALTSFYEDPADMGEDDLTEAEDLLGEIAALAQRQLEEVQTELGSLSDRRVPYYAGELR